MRFDILTIFPEFFGDFFRHGVLQRAFRNGIAEAHTHDLRLFTHDRHRTVDDRPFGGGEGMVLKAQPILEAAAVLGITPKSERDLTRESVILLSASGKKYTQATARELATLERVTLICGRYEGVDERIAELLCDRELCLGDYVLTGGELPAAMIIDSTVRLLPGVLGHEDSNRFESFGEGDTGATHNDADGVPRSTHGAGGLLDYPHYTRPADLAGAKIPDALSSGDHVAIRRWRREAALAKTARNRPDLLETADLSDKDRAFLAEIDYLKQDNS
ncbi:tRNA (guanosine(37)-N1)-methyltransferase TrmD [Granulicella cerasi]|uniref:tRNA (guanine-N(1)-)-methyltransferase n=1 Tax=Granulicella cerasi TaxID=741063 RepID=A0ABW1Z802_9BACT|nr:tRNA (guanosine(37)-N1)-methyltransferase TrmD [Granulicella cerasi]